MLVAVVLVGRFAEARAGLGTVATGRWAVLANKLVEVHTAAPLERFFAPQGMLVVAHTRSGIHRSDPCLLQAISSHRGRVQGPKGSPGLALMRQP
jgi:hypothetical protein